MNYEGKENPVMKWNEALNQIACSRMIVDRVRFILVPQYICFLENITTEKAHADTRQGCMRGSTDRNEKTIYLYVTERKLSWDAVYFII